MTNLQSMMMRRASAYGQASASHAHAARMTAGSHSVLFVDAIVLASIIICAAIANSVISISVISISVILVLAVLVVGMILQVLVLLVMEYGFTPRSR